MPASAGTMPALLIQQKLGKVLQSLLNKPRFSKREESVFKDEFLRLAQVLLPQDRSSSAHNAALGDLLSMVQHHPSALQQSITLLIQAIDSSVGHVRWTAAHLLQRGIQAVLRNAESHAESNQNNEEAAGPNKHDLGKLMLPLLMNVFIVDDEAPLVYRRFAADLMIDLLTNSRENKQLMMKDDGNLLVRLASILPVAGDWELQNILLEILYRCCPRQDRPRSILLNHVFDSDAFKNFDTTADDLICQFNAMQPNDFQKDSREFLNALNAKSRSVDHRPLTLQADSATYVASVCKDLRPAYGNGSIWVDFNAQSVTAAYSNDSDDPSILEISYDGGIISWNVNERLSDSVCLTLYLHKNAALIGLSQEQRTSSKSSFSLKFSFPKRQRDDLAKVISNCLIHHRIPKMRVSVASESIYFNSQSFSQLKTSDSTAKKAAELLNKELDIIDTKAKSINVRNSMDAEAESPEKLDIMDETAEIPENPDFMDMEAGSPIQERELDFNEKPDDVFAMPDDDATSVHPLQFENPKKKSPPKSADSSAKKPVKPRTRHGKLSLPPANKKDDDEETVSEEMDSDEEFKPPTRKTTKRVRASTRQRASKAPKQSKPADLMDIGLITPVSAGKNEKKLDVRLMESNAKESSATRKTYGTRQNAPSSTPRRDVQFQKSSDSKRTLKEQDLKLKKLNTQSKKEDVKSMKQVIQSKKEGIKSTKQDIQLKKEDIKNDSFSSEPSNVSVDPFSDQNEPPTKSSSKKRNRSDQFDIFGYELQNELHQSPLVETNIAQIHNSPLSQGQPEPKFHGATFARALVKASRELASIEKKKKESRKDADSRIDWLNDPKYVVEDDSDPESLHEDTFNFGVTEKPFNDDMSETMDAQDSYSETEMDYTCSLDTTIKHLCKGLGTELVDLLSNNESKQLQTENACFQEQEMNLKRSMRESLKRQKHEQEKNVTRVRSENDRLQQALRDDIKKLHVFVKKASKLLSVFNQDDNQELYSENDDDQSEIPHLLPSEGSFETTVQM